MTDDESKRAEQADAFFDRVIRPQVDVDEDGHKYVAIDLETEDFEVHANQATAANRLIQRHPEAQGRIWFRRVGSRFAHHFGGRPREDDQQ